MTVKPIESTAASGAGSAMLELWRMTMTQRCQHDLRQKIIGKGSDSNLRKVEPAVRVEIFQEARTKATKDP